MNNKNQPQNDQMKGMQTMMYIMPIMFLFIFNSYSSGLSYYYFIATLITILQTWIIRKFVDDQKLLKQIELAKSKPVKIAPAKNTERQPYSPCNITANIPPNTAPIPKPAA